MSSLNYVPSKVKFLFEFDFPVLAKLWVRQPYIGGRVGYNPGKIFRWLLVRKTANWDYRTTAQISGISHPTLIRWNQRFLDRNIYQKFFLYLVRKALKQGLITGEKVAMDSSFVHTFSGHEEVGSNDYDGYHKGYGFRLHCLIDAKSKFPIALVVTDGLTPDCKVAIPLLVKAKPFLKRCGYVLADKGYDDLDIVSCIVKSLKAKAGIPIKKKSKLAKGKTNRYGNLINWKIKAKGRTFKHSVLKLRTEIERFFSKIKRGFHLGKEFTRGIEAFKRNVYLALISYCLERFYAVNITCF